MLDPELRAPGVEEHPVAAHPRYLAGDVSADRGGLCTVAGIRHRAAAMAAGDLEHDLPGSGQLHPADEAAAKARKGQGRGGGRSDLDFVGLVDLSATGVKLVRDLDPDEIVIADLGVHLVDAGQAA